MISAVQSNLDFVTKPACFDTMAACMSRIFFTRCGQYQLCSAHFALIKIDLRQFTPT